MPDLPPTYVAGFHNEEAVSKMRYNPLGSTGLLVSHLAYGGGCLNKEGYGEFDEEEAVKTIHEAIKNGVNYIDTAPWYGNRFSEEFLGKSKGVGVIEAASPAMGLLTSGGPREWHPASQQLRDFCAEMAKYCKDKEVELGHLAVNHALTQHGPATHLIGMQTRALLERNLNILLNGLSEKEKEVLSELESKYLTRVPEKHWEGRELETYWAQMKTLN